MVFDKKQKKIRKIYLEKNRKFIFDFKKDKFCVLCGYKEHPEILQFNHLKDKKRTINDLVQHFSLKKIKEELIKCELLCPNCHFWLNYKERRDKPFYNLYICGRKNLKLCKQILSPS